MKQVNLTPLHQERRSHVTTAEAAAHLSLRKDTLRRWSRDDCTSAQIKPQKVGNRLLWRVSDLRRVLGV